MRFQMWVDAMVWWVDHVRPASEQFVLDCPWTRSEEKMLASHIRVWI